MDNASLILQTLDRHLNHPTRLVLYGRAALQLGFDDPPMETAQSKDVDAIIPLGDLDSFATDAQFWDAQEATNSDLRPKGLYIHAVVPRGPNLPSLRLGEAPDPSETSPDPLAATLPSCHARSDPHENDAWR